MPKFDLDEALIRRLSGLLAETGLTEIEYEAGGQRIRVARSVTVAAPGAAPTGASDGDRGGGSAAPVETVPANAVISPMVGTVYVSPEPGAPPFVSVGDSVAEGQTLLIIEAMKVMNPIPSPRAGRVAQIYVRDGQPVEYGEPLLIIE